MESSTRPMSPATKMRLKGITPKRSQFATNYSKALALLEKEIWYLGAYSYVLEVDIDDRYFRIDGNPRANAVANSPAVAVSFKADKGPMEFICGSFHDWRDNIYSIARGLEALRMIERYGITQAADQYAGFKAIGSGIAMPAASEPQMTVEDAAAFIARCAWPNENDEYQARWVHRVVEEPDFRRNQFHIAASKVHPDKGGDAATFDKLVKARELLEAS